MTVPPSKGRPYDAVIFDLFGTLVPDIPGTVYREMAALLGLEEQPFRERWAADYVDRTLGRVSLAQSVQRAAGQLGVQVPQDLAEAAAAIRIQGARSCLASVDEGAFPTLAALAEAGFKRGLLSNVPLEISMLFSQSPLMNHFDAAVFSADVGVMKPDPPVFERICNRLNVAPKRCLYVGNGDDNELVGAAAVGMTPVQLNVVEAKLTERFARIRSCAEVLPILAIGW